jgi:hypothetical protein
MIVLHKGLEVVKRLGSGSAQVDMDLINTPSVLGQRHDDKMINTHHMILTKRVDVRVVHHLGDEGLEDEAHQIKIYTFIPFEPIHNPSNCWDLDTSGGHCRRGTIHAYQRNALAVGGVEGVVDQLGLDSV